MNILEFVMEVMFEIFVLPISDLWKASRFFRIAVGIVAIIGVAFIVKAIYYP